MGNSDGTPMAEGTFSFAGAGPIWRQIMEAAHEGVEAHEFTVPEGVVFKPCAGRNEAFVEGTECTYVPPPPENTPAATGTPRARPTGTPGAPGTTPVPGTPAPETPAPGDGGVATPVATAAPAEPPQKPTPTPAP
jgi:membrane peptidoglycan carboxypeptidase